MPQPPRTAAAIDHFLFDLVTVTRYGLYFMSLWLNCSAVQMSTLKLDALLVYGFGCHASKALCLEKELNSWGFSKIDEIGRRLRRLGSWEGHYPNQQNPPPKCQRVWVRRLPSLIGVWTCGRVVVCVQYEDFKNICLFLYICISACVHRKGSRNITWQTFPSYILDNIQ